MVVLHYITCDCRVVHMGLFLEMMPTVENITFTSIKKQTCLYLSIILKYHCLPNVYDNKLVSFYFCLVNYSRFICSGIVNLFETLMNLLYDGLIIWINTMKKLDQCWENVTVRVFWLDQNLSTLYRNDETSKQCWPINFLIFVHQIKILATDENKQITSKSF